MGNKTKISWTQDDDGKPGSSWSCLRGCSRTIAAGTTVSGCGSKDGGGCYAERTGYRFSGPGLAYEGLVRMTPNGARWTGKVLLVDEHLLDPIRWQRGRRIFTTSVSDPFHERLTNETIAILFGVMAATGRHTHQCLTKRTRRAREWYGWLANAASACNSGRGMSPAAYCFTLLQNYVTDSGRFSDAERKLVSRSDVVSEALGAEWPLRSVHLGCSVEHQIALDERWADLQECPAALHWFSAEPLLGPLDMGPTSKNRSLVGAVVRRIFRDNHGTDEATIPQHLRPPPSVGWIVAGAESGHGARAADQAWFTSIRDQCRVAEVPLFVKQIVVDGALRHDVADFPLDLRIQEFPKP